MCTNNLRQIERVVADGVEDQVLQLVDHTEQVLSERGHGWRCVLRVVGERGDVGAVGGGGAVVWVLRCLGLRFLAGLAAPIRVVLGAAEV